MFKYFHKQNALFISFLFTEIDILMHIKNLLFVLFVSFHCFYILMISKLLNVKILSKSLLLYINHFDSINKNISNIKRVFLFKP